MELNVSERVLERDCLLEASQREWSIRHAELQSTAAAASQQIQNQQSLVEAQTARLHQVESLAEEEFTSLRQDAAHMQLVHQTLREQLIDAESAETSTKYEAVSTEAEAQVAAQQNWQLWSEVSELRRKLKATEASSGSGMNRPGRR